MEQLLDSLQRSLGESLPGVAGALVILLIGWIIASGLRAVLKKGLNMLKINEKSNSKVKNKEKHVDVESGVATGGYYLVLLFTLLVVFNQLGLEIASQPLQGLVSQVLDFVPMVFAGGLLILVAWLCGRIVKQIITGALSASGIDERIQSEKRPISEVLGEVSYWFIFLLFLPGILDVFGLEGLLQPAQSMIDKIFGMVPNVIAAGIILAVGWFVAKVLRELVTNLTSVAGLDKLGEKAGIKGKSKLSNVAGMIVYFFVFVPAIIASLNALKIAAIADPATQMLGAIMAAIPNILGASAIVLVTYFIAKPVCGFISNILNSIGFDNVPQKLGFKNFKASAKPSLWVGNTIFFFMVLFACVEAANRMQFEQFADFVAVFIQFGGQVILGSAIIAVGLWIANLVAETMNRTAKDGNTPMATIVRFVILGLVLAMGLRAMGLANDIINMAFGLTLGAAAVAFALSFGLGGREAAGKQMEHWLKNLRSSESKSKGESSSQEFVRN